MRMPKGRGLSGDASGEGSAYLKIADEMERLISSEKWKLGQKLPSTKEIAAMFDVTPPTVQRSLSRLARRGFIKRTRRKGTFVTYGNPFEGKVAVVLGRDPLKIESRYYSVLLDSFRRLASARSFPVKYYLDVDESDYGRTIREIEADIASGELSTVVPLYESTMFYEWQSSCGLPVHFANLPALDFRESTRLGMDYLYKRGFKDIAFVSMYSAKHRYAWPEKEGIKEAVAANPGAKPPSFIVGGELSKDGYDIVLDLLSKGSSRPDALFIHHDIMTMGALQALAEEGLRIPKDIALLTHSNKGVDFLSRVPLTKIEFDPADVVSKLLDRLSSNDAEELDESLIKPRLIPGASCGE